MEPWKSWTAVSVIGVAAYLYYSNRQQNNRKKAARAASLSETTQPLKSRSENKTKRKKKRGLGNTEQTGDGPDALSPSLPSSSNENAKSRNGVKTGGKDIAVLEKTLLEDDKATEDVDNREFAKQLSELKTGTSLSTTKSSTQTLRTKKQGLANGFPSPTASSADADDDMSPQTSSPEFGAQGQRGVSDMLEPAVVGPSVLRLTELTQPQRLSQPKQSKPVQEQETKKQRQRQAKKEAAKAERDQAEKERRVLLERQLRTAREAEGRPANHGGPISQPERNAWVSSVDHTASAPNGRQNPLLDTLEPEKTASRDSGSGKGKSLEHDIPSEEEQIRRLEELEGEGGWETVQNQKRRDKFTKPFNSTTKTSNNGQSSDRHTVTSNDSSAAEMSDQKTTGPEYPPLKFDLSGGYGRNGFGIGDSNDDGLTDPIKKKPQFRHLNPEFEEHGHPEDSKWL